MKLKQNKRSENVTEKIHKANKYYLRFLHASYKNHIKQVLKIFFKVQKVHQISFSKKIGKQKKKTENGIDITST